ncbi:MAG: glycosyltransferase [Desulfobacterales bacterium]|nr:glycosyltransferase [Desulfobacterales bacterium]MDD4073733.1 glycosyltransferase [Desulfobacterales bacterium]MDD4392778.1 glycosyltransferase [Desulfobacterales bacterium]
MKYSVIIIVDHKYSDTEQFIQGMYDLFSGFSIPFEILIVANGFAEWLGAGFQEELFKRPEAKYIEFKTKTSQSVCLKAGIKESRGEIVVVCDSYQQITNASLIDLLDNLDNDISIVTPYRQNRVDSLLNQIESRIFNWIISKMVSTNSHDMSCTVKVFRREVLEQVKFYGNLYRFLPILAEERGYKTREVRCDHYQQRGSSGIYSLPYYLKVLIDIVTLYFNVKFSRKPLRFFCAVGLLFILTGFFMVSIIFMQKFLQGYPIGDRPSLLISMLLIVMGIQAASIGLLGEIIAFTHGRHRKQYSIEKVI